MDQSTQTKQLLEKHYQALAKKNISEDILADDFQYIGGNMHQTTPIIGKQQFIDMLKGFIQLFEAMRVKQIIIEDERASVIGNYDLIFPNGKRINGNVAEIWTVESGQLNSLTIFFDTLTFTNNMK